MHFIALGNRWTVPSEHFPARLQPLLVALRMERLENGCLEFGAYLFRSLAQDVFESVLLATLLQASREDFLDRLLALQDSPFGHYEQRLSQSSCHHLLQEPHPVLCGACAVYCW